MKKNTRKSIRKKPREVREVMDGSKITNTFKIGIMKELLTQILYGMDEKIEKCIDFITNQSTGFFTDTTHIVFKKYLQTEYKNKTASINFIFDSFQITDSTSRRGGIVSVKPFLIENEESKSSESKSSGNKIISVNISDADILSNCYEESKTDDDKISEKVFKMIEITIEKFQLFNSLASISNPTIKGQDVCALQGQASVVVQNLLMEMEKKGLKVNLYVERLAKIVIELNNIP